MPTVLPCEAIADVVLVEPDVHGDERGCFVETYRRSWLPLGREMVQANRVDRQRDSLVGLHYHLHQADYWYVVSGQALVVLHDLRTGSPTDGATFRITLGDDRHRHTGVFIPPGVAHGFRAVTDMTMTYMVDGYYNPADELGVAWDDPDVAADWGVAEPILSGRDRSNPARGDLRRPAYGLRT